MTQQPLTERFGKLLDVLSAYERILVPHLHIHLDNAKPHPDPTSLESGDLVLIPAFSGNGFQPAVVRELGPKIMCLTASYVPVRQGLNKYLYLDKLDPKKETGRLALQLLGPKPALTVNLDPHLDPHYLQYAHDRQQDLINSYEYRWTRYYSAKLTELKKDKADFNSKTIHDYIHFTNRHLPPALVHEYTHD